MKTFYLIDGHAQLFRAYFAPFRPLTSPAGEPVKAVFVFTQMLLSLLQGAKPDYLAVAFDVSDGTTHRKRWYPAYKENRDEAPEDLAPQFARVRQVVQALGLPIFELEGYEADDVIATIAERLRDQDVELRIGSRDKDLHQILSDKVKLWDPSSGDLLDAAKLVQEKGYGPDLAAEVQTLTGDATDNVPGAKGVGPKTAAKLVASYGSADAVLEHLSELSPKLRENLAAHAAQIDLTRRLVTLDRDVPIAFALDACRTPAPDLDALLPLFQELGFRGFQDQVRALAAASGSAAAGSRSAAAAATTAGPAPGASQTMFAPSAPAPSSGVASPGDDVPRTYRAITDERAFEAFLAELRRQAAFAVDTETTSLKAVDADIVGYAFSWEAGTGWYLPVRGRHGPVLDPTRVADALRPILANETSRKVGQNLKYDIVVLERAGLTLGGPLFDTMVAAALLHPERRTNNMDDLARDLLGVATTPITDLIGKGKEQRSMLDVELEPLTAYAGEDADVTWRLYQHLAHRLEQTDDDLARLFHEVEMPLVRVLASMERDGVALDTVLLTEIQGSLEHRIAGLRERLVEEAGGAFNPDSPKQLGEVLFDRLGFRVVKRTKTARSTDAEVLETLAAETEHPLPGLLLEYRELTKLLGTYVQPLPSYLAASTGRLHASFHQTGAATGRLSSSDPNIQNIPIRTDAGREIRRAFRARDEGSLLLTADYSQVELRMLAHFSQDEELARAFRDGLDIHAHVASQIFSVPLERVTPEQRRVAKTVNFGIVYGQSAFGLARTLRIPQGDAAEFIAAYKATYVGLDRFLRACVEQAERHGYVRTILGRRRAIDEVRSRNRNLRQLGERLAINTVIQGSAADLIKVAMVRLQERLRERGGRSRLLIQVHDELVLEAPKDEADETLATTVAVMSNALELRVPLRVDAAMGPNWLEGKS